MPLRYKQSTAPLVEEPGSTISRPLPRYAPPAPPQEKPKPKISWPMIIILTAYLLIIDIVDILIKFIGLDDFFILDALTFPVTWIYFTIKGVRQDYNIWGNIIEFIPYVDALPARTVGAIIVFYMDRHPRVQALTRKTVGKVSAATSARGKTSATTSPQSKRGRTDRVINLRKVA